MQHQGNRTSVGAISTRQDFVQQQTQGQGQDTQAQPQGQRQNVGAAPQGSVAVAFAPTTRIAFDQLSGRAGGEKWYLNEADPELAQVTAEARNEALGINSISVFQVNADQASRGILCKVNLDTIIGKVVNISVFESTREAGAIYLQVGGREYTPTTGPNAGKKKWYHDLELSKQAKAQVLRFLDSMLVPNTPNAPQQ